MVGRAMFINAEHHARMTFLWQPKVIAVQLQSLWRTIASYTFQFQLFRISLMVATPHEHITVGVGYKCNEGLAGYACGVRVERLVISCMSRGVSRGTT